MTWSRTAVRCGLRYSTPAPSPATLTPAGSFERATAMERRRYAIARKHGFVGDECAWLQSLHAKVMVQRCSDGDSLPSCYRQDGVRGACLGPSATSMAAIH